MNPLSPKIGWLICDVSVHSFWKSPCCLFINSHPAFPDILTICLRYCRRVLSKEFYLSAISGSVSLSPLPSFPLLLRFNHQRNEMHFGNVWFIPHKERTTLPGSCFSCLCRESCLYLKILGDLKSRDEGILCVKAGDQGCMKGTYWESFECNGTKVLLTSSPNALKLYRPSQHGHLDPGHMI